MQKPRRHWVILASFVVALMLAALPLPDWAAPWRPAWVAMTLIYWCLALPQRIGVFIGWCVGLMLDVLNGSLLGLNAGGLALVAYCALYLHQRIRVFPLGQQALVIGLIIAVYQTLVVWVRGVTGPAQPDVAALLCVPTSMLLWPWLFIVLRDLRRRLQVA